ncbi:helix-turn-helix domain-containing protein [Rheinheimera sp.]|uniref:helix-turn-helix domain-containing protein n=1 Tax=Rheinheimera sp. TaxID=1869214 RepID=UPI0040479BE6
MESSKLLQALRVNAGLSVQELADKSGISRSNIYKIEGSISASPSIEVAKKWVMATKPSDSEFTEWFLLVIRLVVDDRTAIRFEDMDGIEEKAGTQTQPEKLLHKLLPNRFLAFLKS